MTKAKISYTGKPVSAEMKAALRMAMERGGKHLYRWGGGFWTYAPCGTAGMVTNTTSLMASEYFGTTTVQALLDRGLFDVAETRTGRNGTFPISVRLNHLSYEVMK